MKVALFGGTFDPIHNGHVKAAESVLRFTDCREVWFIPVYWHVFKSKGKVSDISHRKRMIELAIAGKGGMRLVDFNRNPVYTIDTIRKAKEQSQENEFVWVIGSDLEPEFHLWKDSEKVVAETKVVVVPEPGFERLQSPMLSEQKGNCIVLWDAPKIDLSSTTVRDKLQKGEKADELVGQSVLQYIKENNLYKNNK